MERADQLSVVARERPKQLAPDARREILHKIKGLTLQSSKKTNPPSLSMASLTIRELFCFVLNEPRK